MIKFYDSHFHIPEPSEAGLQKMLEFMDGTPEMLGGALILNTQAEVDFVAENIENIPDNLAIVPYYNYTPKTYPARIEAQRWIKIHPVLSKISCDEHGKIIVYLKERFGDNLNGIIVHAFPWGTSLIYNDSLPLVLKLSSEFPNTHILVAHGGGHDSWRFRSHTSSLPNILYDFSVTLKYFEGSDILRPLMRYLLYSGPKVLFGTDYPHGLPQQQISELLNWSRQGGLDDKDVETLLNDNFKRYFNIKSNNYE